MTDHQQAAIEAGARAYDPEAWTAYDRESPSTEGRELMVEYSKSKAESILAAAEPHLRRKWAEEEAAKLAKTTVGLAAILDRFLENAEWESSGEEMAQRIIESVQNSLLEGDGE